MKKEWVVDALYVQGWRRYSPPGTRELGYDYDSTDGPESIEMIVMWLAHYFKRSPFAREIPLRIRNLNTNEVIPIEALGL